MLQNQLNRTTLLDVVEDVIDTLDPKNEQDRALFQRGLQLYRGGNVYNVISEYRTIEANITDGELQAFLFLDLGEPSTHSCSCKSDAYCEHIIATLFYCCSVSGGIGDILDMWRQKERLGDALAHVSKASSLLKRKEAVEIDISDWYAYFEQRYEALSVGNPYFSFQIFHAFYQKMLAERPKEQGLGNLFCINAILFSVEKLITTKQHGYSYSTYMIQQRIQEFIDEVEAIPATNDVEIDMTYLETTRNQVVRLLSIKDHYFPTLYALYQLTWTMHLQSLADEQIQSIEADLKKGVHGEQLHYELAHLYFLKENDEEVIKHLSHLESFDMNILLSWMITAADQEQWSRVAKWLAVCHRLLKEDMEKGQPMQDIIHSYLLLYEQFAEQHGIDGYEESLQTFLPYSFYFYCDYLLDNGDFKGWAELHTLLNRDPFIDKDAVKYIEKRQRTVLIPLYHHSIEAHIHEKNRKHYKMAVRYLKKLRTLYKKEKKVDLWEQYIVTLAKTYSRLRAFQEELKKGKIIS